MLTKKEPTKSVSKTPKNSKSAVQAANPSPKTASAPKTSSGTATKANSAAIKKNQQQTKITVKYDAGFLNELYIRGAGANLSWEKGQKLINVKSDEWTWETDTNFAQCEFKILLNDKVYENGENHHLQAGAAVQYTPSFS